MNYTGVVPDFISEGGVRTSLKKEYKAEGKGGLW